MECPSNSYLRSVFEKYLPNKSIATHLITTNETICESWLKSFWECAAQDKAISFLNEIKENISYVLDFLTETQYSLLIQIIIHALSLNYTNSEQTNIWVSLLAIAVRKCTKKFGKIDQGITFDFRWFYKIHLWYNTGIYSSISTAFTQTSCKKLGKFTKYYIFTDDDYKYWTKDVYDCWYNQEIERGLRIIKLFAPVHYWSNDQALQTWWFKIFKESPASSKLVLDVFNIILSKQWKWWVDVTEFIEIYFTRLSQFVSSRIEIKEKKREQKGTTVTVYNILSHLLFDRAFEKHRDKTDKHLINFISELHIHLKEDYHDVKGKILILQFIQSFIKTFKYVFYTKTHKDQTIYFTLKAADTEENIDVYKRYNLVMFNYFHPWIKKWFVFKVDSNLEILRSIFHVTINSAQFVCGDDYILQEFIDILNFFRENSETCLWKLTQKLHTIVFPLMKHAREHPRNIAVISGHISFIIDNLSSNNKANWINIIYCLSFFWLDWKEFKHDVFYASLFGWINQKALDMIKKILPIVNLFTPPSKTEYQPIELFALSWKVILTDETKKSISNEIVDYIMNNEVEPSYIEYYLTWVNDTENSIGDKIWRHCYEDIVYVDKDNNYKTQGDCCYDPEMVKQIEVWLFNEKKINFYATLIKTLDFHSIKTLSDGDVDGKIRTQVKHIIYGLLNQKGVKRQMYWGWIKNILNGVSEMTSVTFGDIYSEDQSKSKSKINVCKPSYLYLLINIYHDIGAPFERVIFPEGGTAALNLASSQSVEIYLVILQCYWNYYINSYISYDDSIDFTQVNLPQEEIEAYTAYNTFLNKLLGNWFRIYEAYTAQNRGLPPEEQNKSGNIFPTVNIEISIFHIINNISGGVLSLVNNFGLSSWSKMFKVIKSYHDKETHRELQWSLRNGELIYKSLIIEKKYTYNIKFGNYLKILKTMSENKYMKYNYWFELLNFAPFYFPTRHIQELVKYLKEELLSRYTALIGEFDSFSKENNEISLAQQEQMKMYTTNYLTINTVWMKIDKENWVDNIIDSMQFLKLWIEKNYQDMTTFCMRWPVLFQRFKNEYIGTNDELGKKIDKFNNMKYLRTYQFKGNDAFNEYVNKNNQTTIRAGESQEKRQLQIQKYFDFILGEYLGSHTRNEFIYTLILITQSGYILQLNNKDVLDKYERIIVDNFTNSAVSNDKKKQWLYIYFSLLLNKYKLNCVTYSLTEYPTEEDYDNNAEAIVRNVSKKIKYTANPRSSVVTKSRRKCEWNNNVTFDWNGWYTWFEGINDWKSENKLIQDNANPLTLKLSKKMKRNIAFFNLKDRNKDEWILSTIIDKLIKTKSSDKKPLNTVFSRIVYYWLYLGYIEYNQTAFEKDVMPNMIEMSKKSVSNLGTTLSIFNGIIKYLTSNNEVTLARKIFTSAFPWFSNGIYQWIDAEVLWFITSVCQGVNLSTWEMFWYDNDNNLILNNQSWEFKLNFMKILVKTFKSNLWFLRERVLSDIQTVVSSLWSAVFTSKNYLISYMSQTTTLVLIYPELFKFARTRKKEYHIDYDAPKMSEWWTEFAGVAMENVIQTYKIYIQIFMRFNSFFSTSPEQSVAYLTKINDVIENETNELIFTAYTNWLISSVDSYNLTVKDYANVFNIFNNLNTLFEQEGSVKFKIVLLQLLRSYYFKLINYNIDSKFHIFSGMVCIINRLKNEELKETFCEFFVWYFNSVDEQENKEIIRALNKADNKYTSFYKENNISDDTILLITLVQLLRFRVELPLFIQDFIVELNAEYGNNKVFKKMISKTMDRYHSGFWYMKETIKNENCKYVLQEKSKNNDYFI